MSDIRVFDPKPSDDYETLLKQFKSAVMLINSQNKQIAYHTEQAGKYRNAINTLDSERAMNAVLTREVMELEAKLGNLNE